MGDPSTAAKRSGAWGALAGAVGGLCCIGPSAAVLLGLGSSSALAGLTFDRGVALAGGAALLLAGTALALRRASSCGLRGIARWRQPALLIATFALAYGLLGLLLPALAARQVDTALPPSSQAPIAALSAPQRRATILVEKMICPPCAAIVRGTLRRNSAVRGFTAETGNEQVTIVYDGGQTNAAVLIAVFPRRYGVTLVSDVALP